MRLYPPVPQDSKQVMEDEIWPNGTKVKKRTRVYYNIYAMGRSTELWVEDLKDFNPKRWLERDGNTGDWSFIARDPFSYPMFQAGPRTCLGKLGYNLIYGSSMTSKMKNGFPLTKREVLLRRNPIIE
ncbi:hypothetical protein RDI58_006818 [Solanum bulbocastanum]|uniref:Cytochrome P450 n=1 Tax=Solanum bulbocastanum TaxID=147425 RepID=A0AAN8TUA0_SOLBU